MARIVSDEKNEYDVIYLGDDELGIESNDKNKGERPCVIIEITDENDAFVIPLTTKGSNHLNYRKIRLSFGSWFDADFEPIFISESAFKYSRLSEKHILNEEDIEKINNPNFFIDKW